MDSGPLYNEPIHVVDYYMNQDYTRLVNRRTRTLCPVKYYYIDFGNSVQYKPEDGPPRIQAGHGGDRTVPEFKTETLCDPFAVDVYRLGNIIRECFTDVGSVPSSLPATTYILWHRVTMTEMARSMALIS